MYNTVLLYIVAKSLPIVPQLIHSPVLLRKDVRVRLCPAVEQQSRNVPPVVGHWPLQLGDSM